METFKYLKTRGINKLPQNPGVYAFLARRSLPTGRQALGEDGNKRAKLLYIGKAANIRERAKQHKELLSLAKQLGFIKTDSEIEALILEAKLIKKYQPKYNVMWRDDKNYFYVCITNEDFPRVFITHQLKCNEKCSRYIGPFVDGTALKQTLKVLRKVFPYYTIKKHPKRLCPWCHLNLCPGPSPDKKAYQKNIKNLIAVLRGKKKTVLINLKKEMRLASQKEDYEKAAKARDQIQSLEKVLAHSKIFESVDIQYQPTWPYKRIEAYDVSNIQGKEATGAMVTFVDGKPDKNFYRRFKIKISGKPNDVAMIKEVLSRRSKHPEWPYPDLILIDGGKAQFNAAKCVMSDITRVKVMSLAKKENKLYIEGQKKPVLLKKLPREIFNLILQLRDEAHRFARKYHHKLREVDFFSNI